MANIAGYPSAAISGSPGKSGRIQGIVIVPLSPLTVSDNKRLTTSEKDQLKDFSSNKQGTTSTPITP